MMILVLLMFITRVTLVSFIKTYKLLMFLTREILVRSQERGLGFGVELLCVWVAMLLSLARLWD